MIPYYAKQETETKARARARKIEAEVRAEVIRRSAPRNAWIGLLDVSVNRQLNVYASVGYHGSKSVLTVRRDEDDAEFVGRVATAIMVHVTEARFAAARAEERRKATAAAREVATEINRRCGVADPDKPEDGPDHVAFPRAGATSDASIRLIIAYGDRGQTGDPADVEEALRALLGCKLFHGGRAK
jgi:hypothetical protein